MNEIKVQIKSGTPFNMLIGLATDIAGAESNDIQTVQAAVSRIVASFIMQHVTLAGIREFASTPNYGNPAADLARAFDYEKNVREYTDFPVLLTKVEYDQLINWQHECYFIGDTQHEILARLLHQFLRTHSRQDIIYSIDRHLSIETIYSYDIQNALRWHRTKLIGFSGEDAQHMLNKFFPSSMKELHSAKIPHGKAERHNINMNYEAAREFIKYQMYVGGNFDMWINQKFRRL